MSHFNLPTSIPGFERLYWEDLNRPGVWGKILSNEGDPISIHLHRLPNGTLQISKYLNGEAVERYNFNTGKGK